MDVRVILGGGREGGQVEGGGRVVGGSGWM